MIAYDIAEIERLEDEIRSYKRKIREFDERFEAEMAERPSNIG